MYYYLARYYDPELGRFASADTILPNVYDAQQLNRFTYVRNNPVKLVDPSGHRLSLGGTKTLTDLFSAMFKSVFHRPSQSLTLQHQVKTPQPLQLFDTAIFPGLTDQKDMVLDPQPPPGQAYTSNVNEWDPDDRKNFFYHMTDLEMNAEVFLDRYQLLVDLGYIIEEEAEDFFTKKPKKIVRVNGEMTSKKYIEEIRGQTFNLMKNMDESWKELDEMMLENHSELWNDWWKAEEVLLETSEKMNAFRKAESEASMSKPKRHVDIKF